MYEKDAIDGNDQVDERSRIQKWVLEVILQVRPQRRDAYSPFEYRNQDNLKRTLAEFITEQNGLEPNQAGDCFAFVQLAIENGNGTAKYSASVN